MTTDRLATAIRTLLDAYQIGDDDPEADDNDHLTLDEVRSVLSDFESTQVIDASEWLTQMAEAK